MQEAIQTEGDCTPLPAGESQYRGTFAAVGVMTSTQIRFGPKCNARRIDRN